MAYQEVRRNGKLQNGSHTVYDIKYHFVWITKYRYEVLKGDVAFRLQRFAETRAVTVRGIKYYKEVYSRIMCICYCHVSELGPSEIMQNLKENRQAQHRKNSRS